jgi:predicted dehydrogenase
MWKEAAAKTVRWGLIGCGDIARRRVAPALRDLSNCDLVAVSRARPELAEGFAREFGARKWCADWRELLRDPHIQAVYVATPVYLHAAQTVAAAEAGKHVLCEKPMAMNVEECERMIAACRANNVKLGIAYYRRFYPLIERIKRLLESGEIGKPVIVQINVYGWFNPQPDHPRYWLIQKEQAGGGPMFDVGCHRVEVLLNLFGPIRRIASVGGAVAFEREVEDTAVALFQFERGTCGVLAVSHAAREAQDTLDIVGTLGSIHVEALNAGPMTIQTSGEVRRESYPPASNLHQPLIADFAAAVIENREPKVSGVMGRAVAEVQQAISQGYAW